MADNMNLLLLLSFVSVSLAIPREEFYSFGSDAGDIALPPNDDGSSPAITLQTGVFPYFETQHTTLYVNNNGDISFDGPVSTFTPQSFPLNGNSLIAPYWADVDTRRNGTVYYRETQEVSLLRRARTDVRNAFPAQIRFQPTFLFIATWDRVGHYSQATERIATFQCVLITDSIISFVKFLYADGEIQWTTGDASGGTDGFGGTPAQVGFDAGDGERFFSVPGSQTASIVNITLTSNVGIPGVWTFQVNGDVAQCDEDDLSNTPLGIMPRAGNQLGGTTVSISGPCLVPTDTVFCQFEGYEQLPAEVGDFDVDTENLEFVAVCLSPAFETPGAKTLEIIVLNEFGMEKYSITTRYYAVSIVDSSEVQHNLEDLLVHPDTRVVLEWVPETVVPMQVENPNSYNVEIWIVRFNMDNGKWEDSQQLSSQENSGRAEVTFPPLFDFTEETVPFAIQVRVSGGVDQRRKRITSSLIERLGSRAMRWTSILYYSLSNSLRRRCQAWCDAEPEGIGQTIIDELMPCPPRINQADQVNSRLVKDSGISQILSNQFFHKGTDCFRSREASPSGYGQQCCYDEDTGNLVTENPGGTVDKVAPIGFVNTLRHFQEDVLPSLWCCFARSPLCSMYYDKRPSDNRTFNPPNPACVYGDPHIVTLDGFKYTFNGLGEYNLTLVGEGNFTFQGRMVQAVNPEGEQVDATVFSAIAMKEGDSDTIQLQAGALAGDPEAFINGEFVDFSEFALQEFNGVTVTKDGNELSARFDSGAVIEVREENGFLSTLLVSLPTTWMGETRGLMGNYNGEIADDLTSSDGTSLSLDSGLQDIHEQFGVTWIIGNPDDSIFSYAEGESWLTYYFPNFQPAYEVTFSDPALEEAANEMCGDDLFCRFDIATTENTEVGLSTLIGSQEFDEIVNNSQPIICDPPCENGVCVATDNCSCSVGYFGDRCENVIVTECDDNPCENGGTCEIRAGSYLCSCAFRYSGISCQEEVVILAPTILAVTSNSIQVSVPMVPDSIRDEANEINVFLNDGLAETVDAPDPSQVTITGLSPETLYTVYYEVCTEEEGCIRSNATNVTTLPGPRFPGSGSGFFSGSGLLPTDCLCERDIECSIQGIFTRPEQAAATGRNLKCTIMFLNEEIDTGSGSNFVIDDSFSSEFLSAGSLSFLSNLGVITRNEGFSDCSVPGGLPVNTGDSILQQLSITYLRADGSFRTAAVQIDAIPSLFETLNFSLNGQLDDVSQCSFITLVQWLLTQPSPLTSAECRDNEEGQDTDIFFQVECSD